LAETSRLKKKRAKPLTKTFAKFFRFLEQILRKKVLFSRKKTFANGQNSSKNI